jgi:thymidylate synthase
MQTVSDIRKYFIQELASERFVIDKTGVKTIELIGASFLADEPTIFGELNHDYIDRELAWYYSQSLSIDKIPGKVPEIWRQVADKDGMINSNYGWCVFSRENYDQFYCVHKELKENPNSRRAVMIYTRPKMWEDYNENGRSDFMCTNAVQYLIRDNTLIAIVQMRSNDVVFGYRNDWAWQNNIINLLANRLHVSNTKILWNVGSLHVYERHFDKVK